MHLGEPTLDPISLATTDPAARAALIAQAAALPDDKAELLVECAEASAYGRTHRMKLLAFGSLAGLVVGGAVVYWARG
jgi:hypothetical protein